MNREQVASRLCEITYGNTDLCSSFFGLNMEDLLKEAVYREVHKLTKEQMLELIEQSGQPLEDEVEE